MNFVCQQSALSQLLNLADNHKHSVLIEGVEGCGKTYLAQQYAKMLKLSDVQIIEPNVQSVKDAIDECYKLDTPVLLCIENLDCGVPAAAYAILKFLEEPSDNIYIVITCRNIYKVPDTIISRSVCVMTNPPIDSDIVEYAQSKNEKRYQDLMCTTLWRCVRTFKDVDIAVSMTPANVEYFNSLSNVVKFKDTVSNIVWKLGHYNDNSETPIELVIRYLIELSDSNHIKQSGIQCIRELSEARIASHAVIAKFVFECKYCE